MQQRGWLALLLPALARSEDYVAFKALSNTNLPPARALSATVLQHTVSANAALGRYAWVFGGIDVANGALNDLWMLDLQTGAWAERNADGAYPAARRGASFVVLSQKSAYLFGGESASRVRRQDMFLLHLGSGSSTVPRWEAVVYGDLLTVPPARTEHTATVVPLFEQAGAPLGMIIFGGTDGDSRPLADLHEFDFNTWTWRELSPTGTPPTARNGHAACLLLNSLLAVFGGANEEVPTVYADVALYDLRRNSWTQTAAVGSELPAGRNGHSMVAIDDTVYIFGGVNAKGEKMGDLWAFNAYSAVSGQLQWSRPTPMSDTPAPRWGHAALVSVGSLLLLGGSGAEGDALLNDAWQMTAGCSGNMTLTAARGAFTDGAGYALNNLDCRWHMKPAVAHSNVLLFFSNLDIADPNDRLSIYDGDAVDATKLLASYTGSTIPPSVLSSGPALTLHFTTDAAGEAGVGFEASYQAVCARGYLYDAVSAGCAPCPAGSYNNVANAAECLPCAAGFYAPAPAATACTQCPSFSTTPTQGAYQLEACICQPGYYGVDNTCAVCADGAECPGGNLMRARAGWCEVKNSEPGVASLFRHCCKPDLCPGGVAAVCDESTAVVGVDDCAVRLLTWDSIHLVSISGGTWITCVVMLVLLLLLCFCGGAALGWRKAIQRFEMRVVPTMKAPATPKSAGRSPQRLEYVEEIDGGGSWVPPSRATPPQPEAAVAPERNSRRMPLRRNHALEPSGESRMSASMPDEPPYEEPGDLVIVSLDEPPSVGPQPALVSLSSPGEGSQSGADQLSPAAAQQDLIAQQAALIATTRQAAAKLSSQGSAPPPSAGGEGGAEPTELPQPSVRTPTKGAVAAAEVRPLLEATPPDLEQGSPEEEEAAAAEAAVEPAAEGKKEKKKKGKKGEAEEGGSEEGSEAGGKKKKGKKGKGGDGADEEGEAEGADKKKKKKKEKK